MSIISWLNHKKYLKLIEKGRNKFLNGEYEEASKLYKEAFEYGFYVEDLNSLGFIYIELNKLLLAEEMFNAVLEKENNSGALYGLGCVAEQTGKTEEALGLYERSIESNADFPDVYFDSAYIYDELGLYEKAKTNYLKVIEFEKDNFWAHLNLGTVYEKESNYIDALKEYEIAYNIDSSLPMVCYNLGIVHTKMGNSDLAIKYYLEEVKKENRYKHAYFNLAILYKDHLKDYELAKMAYLKGIEDDKEHYLIWYNLGCLYALMNDFKNAYDCFIYIKYKSPKVFNYIKEDEELLEFRKSDEYINLIK